MKSSKKKYPQKTTTTTTTIKKKEGKEKRKEKRTKRKKAAQSPRHMSEIQHASAQPIQEILWCVEDKPAWGGGQAQ